MRHDFEIENGHFFPIKLLFLIIFFLLMEIENKTMYDEYTYLSARGSSADAAKLGKTGIRQLSCLIHPYVFGKDRISKLPIVLFLFQFYFGNIEFSIVSC